MVRRSLKTCFKNHFSCYVMTSDKDFFGGGEITNGQMYYKSGGEKWKYERNISLSIQYNYIVNQLIQSVRDFKFKEIRPPQGC